MCVWADILSKQLISQTISDMYRCYFILVKAWLASSGMHDSEGVRSNGREEEKEDDEQDKKRNLPWLSVFVVYALLWIGAPLW